MKQIFIVIPFKKIFIVIAAITYLPLPDTLFLAKGYKKSHFLAKFTQYMLHKINLP